MQKKCFDNFGSLYFLFFFHQGLLISLLTKVTKHINSDLLTRHIITTNFHPTFTRTCS